MHFEPGHQVYAPPDTAHPAVPSTACPPDRRLTIKRTRSASNPARSIDSHDSHWPSGEYRGVLSAPLLSAVTAWMPLPSGPITYTSTLVLSATVESPCIATAISRPSGDTATSPSPPVEIAGTSPSSGVRSFASPPPLASSTRYTCWRCPARKSSQWRHSRSVHNRASVG